MRTTILHGPRTDLRNLALIVPLALGGIAFGLFVLLHYRHGLGWDQVILQTLALVGFIETVSVLVHLATVVERAELSDEGIALYGRMGPRLRRSIPWEELRPPSPPTLGFAAIRWSSPGGYLKAFQVTVSPTILRGVLLDERCPRWSLAPAMLRRIGLPPDWAKSQVETPRVTDPPESDAEYVKRKVELALVPGARAAIVGGTVFLVLSVVATAQAYYTGFYPEYAFAPIGTLVGILLFLMARRGFREARAMTRGTWGSRL